MFYGQGFFFINSTIPPGLNSSPVILIPKVDGAVTITDFRPITLNNFLFKVITKILASRLNAVARTNVYDQQYGFIATRKIHDCISLASEGVNCLHRTAAGKNVASKVDIRKAFDTLRWNFLLKVLYCFGFPVKFIGRITSILNSARLSILVNGAPKGYFSCSEVFVKGTLSRRFCLAMLKMCLVGC